jgi:hypothetical protein
MFSSVSPPNISIVESFSSKQIEQIIFLIFQKNTSQNENNIITETM